MDNPNQRINFRYKCKINDTNYNIQLFNINHEKIKIMIYTKNSYSDDYVEYSNIYTLIQFQEITRYFVLFETIDEVFEDLARTIQEQNFSINHNGRTMTFTIKVLVNKKSKCVNFILDKNKTIDLSSQKENVYFNTISTNSKNKYSYVEKSKRNIDISSINELNTLLSDFKERIAILEANQNNPLKNYAQTEKNGNENVNYLQTNETLSQGIENILLRISKLERENDNKDKQIEKLEKKLKFYESLEHKNNTQHIPLYQNPLSARNLAICPQYNSIQLQTQRLPTITFTQEIPNQITKYNQNNKPNQYKLKQNKSAIFNKNYNNNENISLHSKETGKMSHMRNNSYGENRKSYKNNPDKETFKSNNMDINSSYLKMNDIYTNNSMVSGNSNLKDRYFQKYLDYKEKIGIPIIPRENLKKYVNSRIIFTKNELRILKNKFSADDPNLHVFFDLLYRASVDGDMDEIVRSSVESEERTLTLFYTYEGARFGVYIERKIGTSFINGKIYKEVPGTSFIVSLNNLRFFNIAPDKTSREGYEDYLCFGRTYYLNDNGTNYLIATPKSKFLKKKCIIGTQKGSYYDYDPEILVGSRLDYYIKDVEIFHVALEKDDEEEEEEEKEETKKKKKKKKK